MRPVLVAGLERPFDQQAAKAGAVDEQVGRQAAAAVQRDAVDEAVLRSLDDLDDLALYPLDAARRYYDSGRFEAALSCAAQSSAFNPDSPQAHSERGAALSALGRFDEAQLAYARAVENLTGADLSKLFPAPRIPTDKIPECQPHIERGLHTKLYRYSPSDYLELAAVFNGTHPETGDQLVVEDSAPEGYAPFDLPPQEGVFAPDYAPEEISEIAQKLRKAAGLPDKVTGVVANDADGLVGKVKEKLS